jgi:hypothetical protein
LLQLSRQPAFLHQPLHPLPDLLQGQVDRYLGGMPACGERFVDRLAFLQRGANLAPSRPLTCTAALIKTTCSSCIPG